MFTPTLEPGGSLSAHLLLPAPASLLVDTEGAQRRASAVCQAGHRLCVWRGSSGVTGDSSVCCDRQRKGPSGTTGQEGRGCLVQFSRKPGTVAYIGNETVSGNKAPFTPGTSDFIVRVHQ